MSIAPLPKKYPSFAILADSALGKKGNGVFLLRVLLCWLFWQPVLATQTVNVNTADAAQLASALSGIGEKKAQLIVAWRQEHGHFNTLNDLAKVKGLGAKLIERNKDIIVFSDSTKQNYLREKSDRDNSTLIWPTPSHAY